LAVDPALAGLLGALVGGAATFGGSMLGNRQLARHNEAQRHFDRKVEAYGHSLRSLLRAMHRRSLFTDERWPVLGKDILGSWFEDLADAEYCMFVLTTACGSQHRPQIEEATQALFREVSRFATEGYRGSAGTSPLGAVTSAYAVVTRAARDDIGFVE
jgi:hypothetical protein